MPNNPTETVRTHYTIPVLPHLKKFVLKEYPHKGNVIQVDEYSVLGNYVTLALREPFTTAEHSQYRDRLRAEIVLALNWRQSRELSPRLNKLIRINRYMDRVFKDHLIAWIKSLKQSGIPPHTACRMFLDYYDIHDEYPLGNAAQYWQRTKTKVISSEKGSESV